MSKDTLTITDNRTGEVYEVPIHYPTYPKYAAYIDAAAIRQIQVSDDDFGLLTYDPGYGNTASCKSSVAFVDGDKGILNYRGYGITDLATNCTFLEVAYLLLNGELPTESEMGDWRETVRMHTLLHENFKEMLKGFHYNAHPMGMLVGIVGALGTFYPNSKACFDEEVRCRHIMRIIAKIPTIAAYCYRHTRGLPYVEPDNSLTYSGNFLRMMFKHPGVKYEVDPAIVRALMVLFILHADHEQNCSTSVMRSVGSSLSDPYSSVAGAATALYGVRHGGANEAVIRMLTEIGTKDRIPEFIEGVKSGEKGRLMGFGHRVYKNFDPRATIIKNMASEVFEATGVNPLLEIALELERIALEDEYFISRKLYPNVDFYSGIIYQSIGFPTDMFPVLFAIGRAAGWLSQWQEMLNDPDFKIVRPRQAYIGYDKRDFVPMSERKPSGTEPACQGGDSED